MLSAFELTDVVYSGIKDPSEPVRFCWEEIMTTDGAIMPFLNTNPTHDRPFNLTWVESGPRLGAFFECNLQNRLIRILWGASLKPYPARGPLRPVQNRTVINPGALALAGDMESALKEAYAFFNFNDPLMPKSELRSLFPHVLPQLMRSVGNAVITLPVL